MSDAGEPATGSEFGPGLDADTEHREVLMELDDVSVEFNMDRGVAKVLDNVSMDIYKGETIAIVGESGSGKSMLASSMLDAVPEPGKTTGTMTFHTTKGEELDVLELDDETLRRFRWEAVSMVFQGAMNSFNPVMTIRDHFKDTLEAHDANNKENFQRGIQLLEDLYLDPDRILESYPHELSGGQKQRALIALSLILKPQVLVMDEPTAALDLLMQRSIIDLLGKLQEEYGFTLVFITHDLPLVKNLCDRLAVMYAFELVEVGPVREIIGHSTHPYTRALLNATPNLNTPVSGMQPIKGEAPDPINVPMGCSYHPRCPMSEPRCEEENPSLVDVDEDHQAACFFWDDVSNEIPLNVPGADGGDASE